LENAAKALSLVLVAKDQKVVFAESCSCGLVVAALGQVPGISNYLCGSQVTYRESAKQEWLDVSPGLIQDYTAESQQVASDMAQKVLGQTSEANWAAGVTGHLGPGAPSDCDGLCFVAVASQYLENVKVVHETAFRLRAESRTERQIEVSEIVIDMLRKQILNSTS